MKMCCYLVFLFMSDAFVVFSNLYMEFNATLMNVDEHCSVTNC